MYDRAMLMYYIVYGKKFPKHLIFESKTLYRHEADLRSTTSLTPTQHDDAMVSTE